MKLLSNMQICCGGGGCGHRKLIFMPLLLLAVARRRCSSHMPAPPFDSNSLGVSSPPLLAVACYLSCPRQTPRNWNRNPWKEATTDSRVRMVLVLNGVLQDDCPMDTNSLFLQHPVYRDYAQQLHSIQAKSVGPVGLLYVGQRSWPPPPRMTSTSTLLAPTMPPPVLSSWSGTPVRFPILWTINKLN